MLYTCHRVQAETKTKQKDCTHHKWIIIIIVIIMVRVREFVCECMQMRFPKIKMRNILTRKWTKQKSYNSNGFDTKNL